MQIEADYPGANAEILADSVARPIEVQLPGIDNLLYYDSTSTNDGHMSIKLTFEIGTDVPISRRSRRRTGETRGAPSWLPEVVRQGISINKVSPDLLAVVALSSTDPTYDTVIFPLCDSSRVPTTGSASVAWGTRWCSGPRIIQCG